METIEIKNVSKSFKEQQVLIDVNLKLEEGHIYGLIGRNGSGKTVLLKIICGMMTPDKGEIFINGTKLDKGSFPTDIGVIIENPGFISLWSGYRNLKYLASFNQKIEEDKILEVMQEVGLSDAIYKRVGKYSLGMKQRLGIAQAIMENPNILILDEPFNGLDKNGVDQIYGLLKEFKKQGKTIFLVSHIRDDIEAVCDCVYEIEHGRVKRKGDIESDMVSE